MELPFAIVWPQICSSCDSASVPSLPPWRGRPFSGSTTSDSAYLQGFPALLTTEFPGTHSLHGKQSNAILGPRTHWPTLSPHQLLVENSIRRLALHPQECMMQPGLGHLNDLQLACFPPVPALEWNQVKVSPRSLSDRAAAKARQREQSTQK